MASQTSHSTTYAPVASLPRAEGAVTLTMADPACRFIFRGAPEAAERASAGLGVTLPNKPCRAQRQGARAALWLGPDEWLLLGPLDAAQNIASAIAEKLTGTPHALVDITDRNVGLMLDGPASEDVLSAGCPLDLDITAFPAGMCTRTLFGKAEIVLWRTSPQSFRLEVARSFLPYVVNLLHVAVRDAAAMRKP